MTAGRCLQLFAALLLFHPALAMAQGEGKRPGYGEYPMADISGTLVGGNASILQVKDSTAKPFLVQVSRRTRVRVSGEAEQDWLYSGLLVKFTTILNSKGIANDPLGVLQVITPSQENQPGVYGGDAAGTIDFTGEKTPKDPANSPRTVIGVIRSARSGKLLVATPVGNVQASLAKDATVTVEMDSMKFAQPNSAISVKGSLVEDAKLAGNELQPGKIIAREVSVRLDYPLGGKPMKAEEN